MHNDEDDICPCEMCSPAPVTLSRKPVQTDGGEATAVMMRVAYDATEDDVRRALVEYPDAVESAVRTWREMREKMPTRFVIEA